MDFSILKPVMDQMATQLGIYVGVLLVIGLIVVFVLKFFRVPNLIAKPLATFAILLAAYYSFPIIIG